MSIPRPCQAKDPQLCPYHGSIYGRESFTALVKKIDGLHAHIKMLNYAVGGGGSTVFKGGELGKLILEHKLNAAILDATPQGLAILKEKTVKRVGVPEAKRLEWQHQRFQALKIVQIRKESSERFNNERAKIEGKRFGDKTTKLLRLRKAVRVELAALERNCDKDKFFADKSEHNRITTAYDAVKYELTAFGNKIPLVRVGTINSLNPLPATAMRTAIFTTVNPNF